MNIYLDIDGTLIHEDRWDLADPAAAGLADFIVALRPHTPHWLTTHCRNGDPTRAREIMKRHLPEELHADVDRILPTTWDTLKTEGIDWTESFIWFDNSIAAAEWARIEQGSDDQLVIEVNLEANPTQLFEITRDVLG